MDVGKRIKELRKSKGISAETIAERLGTNPTTIYRYENGDISKMPISILEPIAKILGTNPGYLMGWTDDPDPRIKTTTPISEDTMKNLLRSLQSLHLDIPVEDDSTDDDDESPFDHSDIEKAFKLYERYKNAIPQVQHAVDALLKPDQPDS